MTTAANQVTLHPKALATPLPFEQRSYSAVTILAKNLDKVLQDPPSQHHSLLKRKLDAVEIAAIEQREASEEEDTGIDPRVLEKLQKLKDSATAVQAMIRGVGAKAEIINHDEQIAELPPVDFSQVKGKSIIDTVFDLTLQVFKQPDIFVQRYTLFAKELMDIVQSKSELQAERGDRRFRDPVWQDNPIYRIALQTYLAWNNHMQGLVDELKFDDEFDHRRANFLLNQLSAALSPSNSPLNPVAVKRAYQTGGQSVLMGLQNLLRDILTNSGMPRQVAKEAYVVGSDLGNTPGAVVYRSRIFELIQYGCADKDKVYQRPVLIVPPQINKFYIFDLSPKNSLVKHLLDSGLQVFIISWKNPQTQHADWGLETYIKEMEKGIDAILDISNSRDISLVSACAGGITSMALQAYYANKGLANKGSKVIHNHSVLVTAFSAEDHPTLDLFLNKESLQHTLQRTQAKGLMEGRELAHVFAWLRPTDLVWNYWVNNNLLGKEPPTMDVLFWDNDSTRLPAALHRDFIDVLLNNRFVDNDEFVIDGQPLSISKLRGDFYFLAGDEDYLMPWKNCYKDVKLLPNAKCEFVLSNSGHIQSVLRPPGIGNTHYYTNPDYSCDANTWLDTAQTHKGSWWEHWTNWLAQRSSRQRKAPQVYGSENYPPICPSPGVYVAEK
jgi:polyhydroxyalkanoate synthase